MNERDKLYERFREITERLGADAFEVLANELTISHLEGILDELIEEVEREGQ